MCDRELHRNSVLFTSTPKREIFLVETRLFSPKVSSPAMKMANRAVRAAEARLQMALHSYIALRLIIVYFRCKQKRRVRFLNSLLIKQK